MKLSQTLRAARSVLFEAHGVYFVLLKIMVPALILVKVLQELAAMQVIGSVLASVMSLTGLPAEFGIVWATTLLTNMFSGIVVFVGMAGDLSLSVEQVTVLGSLMLIGHSISIEGAVARRAGVPWWVTLASRVGGTLVFGSILHLVYTRFNLLQEPATVVWRMPDTDDSLAFWVLAQLETLVIIYFVILSPAFSTEFNVVRSKKPTGDTMMDVPTRVGSAPDTSRSTVGNFANFYFISVLLVNNARKNGR